jgi:hypothetical protein
MKKDSKTESPMYRRSVKSDKLDPLQLYSITSDRKNLLPDVYLRYFSHSLAIYPVSQFSE